MAISTISSSSLSPNLFPCKSYVSSRTIYQFSRLAVRNCDKVTLSLSNAVQSFNPRPVLGRFGLSGSFLRFRSDRQCEFRVRAEKEETESGEGDTGADEAEISARGESTMPERFRYLTKEAPETPVRWPWFVALAFLVYAWRAVLFELSNWRKAAFGILGFVGDLSKLALALVFHFIGDPITSCIRFVETLIYSIRAFYSALIARTPIRELTTVILLASSVLAIGEAVAPNSVNCQPYILTVAGCIGYAAVQSYISEPVFWTLLVGLYGFSRLIKKHDDLTSALPVAAVLAAVGEPWVRVLAMSSYVGLAIFHHSKKLSEGKQENEVAVGRRSVPLPLLAAALAIGVRVAAKWAGYRHLTWMIA